MQANDFAGLYLIAGNVHAMAIHHHVSVVDELSCIKNTSCKSQSVHQSHETRFQHEQEVVRFVTLKFGRPFEGLEELLFHHPVSKTKLLLFQKLLAVGGAFPAS